MSAEFTESGHPPGQPVDGDGRRSARRRRADAHPGRAAVGRNRIARRPATMRMPGGRRSDAAVADLERGAVGANRTGTGRLGRSPGSGRPAGRRRPATSPAACRRRRRAAGRRAGARGRRPGRGCQHHHHLDQGEAASSRPVIAQGRSGSASPAAATTTMPATAAPITMVIAGTSSATSRCTPSRVLLLVDLRRPQRHRAELRGLLAEPQQMDGARRKHAGLAERPGQAGAALGAARWRARSRPAPARLPIASRTMPSAAISGTPLTSSVPSVRVKRAARTSRGSAADHRQAQQQPVGRQARARPLQRLRAPASTSSASTQQRRTARNWLTTSPSGDQELRRARQVRRRSARTAARIAAAPGSAAGRSSRSRRPAAGPGRSSPTAPWRPGRARAPAAPPAAPAWRPACRPPRRRGPGRHRGAGSCAGWRDRARAPAARRRAPRRAARSSTARHAAVRRGLDQEAQRAVEILPGAEHDRRARG